MILRWLLPIVTALALVGQAVTAWAAAGVIGEASCCCPVPDDCKCHDHEGGGQTELRRCTGDAERVVPAPLAAAVPDVPEVACEVTVARAAPPSPPPLPDHRADPPEKPPF